MTEAVPIHPGEVLREEFLVPLGISQYRLAKDLGIPETRVSEICLGRRAITADTALRLGRYFRTSPEFWLNLQNSHDLQALATSEKAKAVARVRPYDEEPRRNVEHGPSPTVAVKTRRAARKKAAGAPKKSSQTRAKGDASAEKNARTRRTAKSSGKTGSTKQLALDTRRKGSR